MNKLTDRELTDIIKTLVRVATDVDNCYFEAVDLVARIFPARLEESLSQLVFGPVYDGDIISKSMRDELFDLGLAVRVCCKGEQGYTGAAYIGFSILKSFREFASGKK